MALTVRRFLAWSQTSIRTLATARHHDRNGVSAQPGELLCRIFNEPALNTFSDALAEQRNGQKSWRNDWSRWRPKIVVAEYLDGARDDCMQDPVIAYINMQSYFVFAKKIDSVFYLHSN